MKKAAFAVCLLVFLWQVYRAAVTPVTDQEAITYNGFVSQPGLKILAFPYNPANQVAHSLLCRLVIHVFRLTEFSLRIPSLLGFLLYLWAAFRLVPPTIKSRLLAFCALVANPFTLGWLPQSTGFWMAAGLFVLGCRELARFQGEPQRLALASMKLGLAGCFYIPFLFVAVGIVFLFLYFEFWGKRRIGALVAINNLILPATLLCFCFWGVPLVKASKLVLPNPNRFTPEPAPNLAFIARALRNDLRLHPPRLVRVAASPILIDRLNFYRRRYALGAVQDISPLSSLAAADYTIIFDPQSGDAKLNAAKLVEMNQ